MTRRLAGQPSLSPRRRFPASHRQSRRSSRGRQSSPPFRSRAPNRQCSLSSSRSPSPQGHRTCSSSSHNPCPRSARRDHFSRPHEADQRLLRIREDDGDQLRLFAWRMKILPSLIYLELRHMTSGEFPHQLLTTGILLWKNYADWLDENRPTYLYAIIFETWWPIRNSRTSLWWPHGRLSCNLVSYLLITRHLHQCRFNFGSLSMAGGNIGIVYWYIS